MMTINIIQLLIIVNYIIGHSHCGRHCTAYAYRDLVTSAVAAAVVEGGMVDERWLFVEGIDMTFVIIHPAIIIIIANTKHDTISTAFDNLELYCVHV